MPTPKDPAEILRQQLESRRQPAWQKHALERLAALGSSAPKAAAGLLKGWNYSRDGFDEFQRARIAALTELLALDDVQRAAYFAAWWATASEHLRTRWGSGPALAPVLAAALDAGDAESTALLDILKACARGQHPVGQPGHHIYAALLISAQPAAWEFVEQMLLTAQREEGLRQSILESVDRAHPSAFCHLLRVVLEHDLIRFSSVARAADVWFGLVWDSSSTTVVRASLERALRFLGDEPARHAALAGRDAETAYFALWSEAFLDAPTAIARAQPLLRHAQPTHRLAACHLLGQLGLNPAYEALVPMLEDPDLRIRMWVLSAVSRWSTELRQFGDSPEPSLKLAIAKTHHDVFVALERSLASFPAKPPTATPLLWPWTARVATRSQAANLLCHFLGDRSPEALLPHLDAMDANGRLGVVVQLAEIKQPTASVRAALLSLAGDTSSTVRDLVLARLAQLSLAPAEAPAVEALLTRTAAGLRRGALGLLLTQSDSAALASAGRLLDSTQPKARLGGLELLRQLAEANRNVPAVRARVEGFTASSAKLTSEETRALDPVLAATRVTAAKSAPATLENCLGLIDPARRTPVPLPVDRGTLFVTAATIAVLESLDALIHEHRERLITFPSLNPEPTTMLLGDTRWGVPHPKMGDERYGITLADLPLREVWETWLRTRPAELRDPDGCELLRAFFLVHEPDTLSDDFEERKGWGWRHMLPATRFTLPRRKKLRYPQLVKSLVLWLPRLEWPADGAAFILDALESSVACLEPRQLVDENEKIPYNYLDTFASPFVACYGACQHFLLSDFRPASKETMARIWGLMRWFDEPVVRDTSGTISPAKVRRCRDRSDFVLTAFQHGLATPEDLYDLLLGPRDDIARFDILRLSTARKPDKFIAATPALKELAERCRDRVLDIELARGDLPTPASVPARFLSSIPGTATFVRILVALGDASLRRGGNYAWRADESKPAVLSHVLRVSYPTADDTPEQFATAWHASRLPESQLIEAAMFAPQWTQLAEHALGWPGLATGIWWIYAHTRDRQWSVDQEVRDSWTAQIGQRTPLAADDLLDGAVDVAWFNAAHAELGAKRWAALDNAAKFASAGTGHTRAQLFSRAMLGDEKKSALLERLRTKRHQDAARALGLLPLAAGRKRQPDVLERYTALQEFIRASKQFGSQRQASEKRAATIGMENLARAAGFADPIRLQWAMEALAIADLADGPITVEADGVTVTLSVDPFGEVELAAHKGERALAEVPAAVRKLPAVKALSQRKAELKRQASRIRTALEQMMVRGDALTGAELRELQRHPLLAPMLASLVLVLESDATVAGYPVKDGQALENYAGKLAPLAAIDRLRIAHPHDLFATGAWHEWQRDCFARERIQPCKQVFRELYPLTAAERTSGATTPRYAGQQVQPRQALALLGGRGWITVADEGVRRVFHEARLGAVVHFMEAFYTPAEIEGLTLEGVSFFRKGDGKAVPLAEVPPRLFSEVMRDLDLVVSVAHRGGVDPEASMSTVESRAALVRETATMLSLANVRVTENRALIDGRLGHYSLHLGSGQVHRMPGGALFLVPVHAQHRGRLFLPFADNDPKTAEILTKVLLLARDHEIKDPSIRAQLASG